jgi:hypothetical protein
MITKLHSLLIGLALAASLHQAAAQGTAFTYQGRLNDGTNPANGQYDFQFQVFDAATAGASYGSPNPNTVAGVGVSNGLFTVTLDFGGSVFTGPARWLQTSVRTNGSASYTLLNARQPLTATPYAIYAGNAATLGGQASTAYVAKTGDTMTGRLNLPSNGLNVGGSQLVTMNGNVGIGTTSPSRLLEIYDPNNPGAQMRLSAPNGNLGMEFVTTNPTVYNWRVGAQSIINDGFEITPSTTPGSTTFTSPALAVLSSGNVGIGTTTPACSLDVNGAINAANGFIGSSAFHGNGQLISVPFYYRTNLLSSSWAAGVGDYVDLQVPGNDGGGNILRIASSGNLGPRVGIGTTNPSSPLHVQSAANVPLLQLTQTTPAYWCGLSLANSSGSPWFIDEQNGPTPGLEFYANNNFAFGCDWSGTFTVKVLQITGGSDIAEPFNLSTKDIPKGAVVVIDEDVPGQLKLSGRPYDTRVAGIISGANGINPGLSLHQQGALEGGENVALSGRVYALADASLGAINPGDLLTTSSTPGHCMKVTDHAKAQGAIIGKAMSSLEKGKGMVLVLVSLQ